MSFIKGKRLNLLKTIEVMLPINVNDLLEKNRGESNRIEFKEGWNPVRIYQSICHLLMILIILAEDIFLLVLKRRMEKR